MNEHLLREEIRANLNDALFYNPDLVTENYAIQMQPGEFSQIFFEPWKNVLKGAFVDLKKIASQVVTTVRLLFTLNQKKAEEIVARQKDRMKKFNAESEEIFQALGGNEKLGDFAVMAFAANPGAWIAGKMAGGAPEAVGKAIDVAREIGIGDKSINTVTGEEQEEDALIRRREEDGPVKKALRAIEQIFFLAHAQKRGSLLTENVDYSDMTAEILAGPLGQSIKEAQAAMYDSAKDLIGVITSIDAQNNFMASTAQETNVQNPEVGLKRMSQALSTLSSIDPESAKSFEDLPKRIADEAKKLSESEKFRESEIKKAGKDDVDFAREALKAVMGTTFNDTVEPYTQAIEDNKNVLADLIFGVFPEEILTKDFVASINNEVNGFSDAIRRAEKILQRQVIS